MSAIYGICNFNHEPVPLEDGMILMKALEQHQADDAHFWKKDPIFLGCHAQWITSESIGEQLPYYDELRQLAITADVIIDNREELFERLQVEYPYRKTMTDSELILHAYYKWGEETPKFIIGDFAFMIWDERKRLLFGARDFSGSRTLYYYDTFERFAFCTTMQPLLTLPYINNQLNDQWLAEYLANPGRIETVEATSTVYQNIRQVPPSHTITITEGKVKFSRYCTFAVISPLKLKSNGEYEEALRDVFQRAVTSRLRTHRQVGSYLSGGLDSGSVVSFAAKALQQENKKLYTYSYIPEEDFIDWTPKNRMADERPFIQSTVQHVGNIKDHYLDFHGKSPLSEVDEWLDTMEMPYKFIENSFWLSGIYEKASQQGVGVLLNGGRGNHSISWGPAMEYYATLLKRLNLFRLYHELNLYSKNKGIGRRRLLSEVRRRAFPWSNAIQAQEGSSALELINPEFAKQTEIYAMLQRHGIERTGLSKINPNLNELRIEQYERFMNWTTSGISGTKLSLRHAVWYRDPTNDLRVVRFCLSVPAGQFVQDGMDRALIRRSTAGLLPDNVRLNYKLRGIQGSDSIHRMARDWVSFTDEIDQLCVDTRMKKLLNIPFLQAAISKMRGTPDPKLVYDGEFTMLMRGLIVYRFIKNLEGR
ncbi:lasso peptide isopeptide bond-forming cyclase [Cohnella luojiensis]|uniref:asparagine synthase (glutamine-hydrolyzing) n=1 Tax=Cohnella luojiensis TaxID=652876 RepID=A0A4Y8LRI1_9BACL|nr:lasso peptide isopeptide bond-forming cyclase [Cohnella luojiensis]TFE22627.1 lasso peptide isopeptide bond-forming cyclase [Cohnella luojiensis]